MRDDVVETQHAASLRYFSFHQKHRDIVGNPPLTKRGHIVGDGLDPEYVARFSASLGSMLNGGTVVLSRDGRSTGEMLRHAVVSGLMATGCKVLDLGIASTPTCGVMVTALGAAGGLQLTASHNPIEWNGLKPFSAQGSVLDKALGEQLLAVLKDCPDHVTAHLFYPGYSTSVRHGSDSQEGRGRLSLSSR